MAFSIASGVRVFGVRPEMFFAVTVLKELCDARKVDCVITAGIEGSHTECSDHYAGNALDFRTRDLSEADRSSFALAATKALGEDYFVLLETNPPHLHISFRPKKNYSAS